jgi:hypothetical protein
VFEAEYLITDADAERTYVENVATASGLDPLFVPVEASDSLRLWVAAGGAAALETPCDGKVIISEVAWAGTPSDPADEWIELRNIGSVPVDLTGWVIRWRKKNPQTPEEERWRVVELSGVIEPSSASPCLVEAEPLWTDFMIVRREADGVVWWELVAEPDTARDDPGFFLLERRHDATVRDVPAGLVYDPDGRFNLDLPDEGAVIELVNAAGEVVDTANADDPNRPGWPAGDAVTRATMERIDPLAPDTWDNWRTNYGLLAFGEDAEGVDLLATAGGRNEGYVDWTSLPEGLAEISVDRQVALPLEVPRSARAQGWPRVIIGALAQGEVAGGGAAVPYGAISSIRQNDTYILVIDPAALLPGEYRLWVVLSPGHVALMGLVVR